MRILVVYDVAYPFTQGGGQKRMWEVASRLSIHGHQVDWLCFKTWGESDSLLNLQGINYIGIPGFKGLYKKNGRRRILEPIEFLYAMFKNRISLEGYDLVWLGQWPLSHILFFLFSKFNKKNIFVDWWEIWGRTWFRYSFTSGWIGYLLEKALLWIICRYANLVVISEKADQYLKNDKWISAHSVSMISNGINCDALNSLESKPKIFKLVYFGRLQKHKNVDLLIMAVAYIRSNYAIKVNLRIIGNGPEKPNLINLIHKYSLGDIVEIISYTQSDADFYSLISESLIFVNPSTKEGGGSITTLEAFGLGLPVIGFDCKDGIDSSLLSADRGGFLVNTVSEIALGDAVVHLLSDENLVFTLSQNGKKYSNSCDWNEIAMQYHWLFSRATQA